MTAYRNRQHAPQKCSRINLKINNKPAERYAAIQCVLYNFLWRDDSDEGMAKYFFTLKRYINIHNAKKLFNAKAPKFKFIVTKTLAHFDNYRLGEIIYTGVKNENAHEALSDVKATLGVTKWFIRELKRLE